MRIFNSLNNLQLSSILLLFLRLALASNGYKFLIMFACLYLDWASQQFGRLAYYRPDQKSIETRDLLPSPSSRMN